MKAVLISVKPLWCELIANGEKIVEVRKTKPKLETPFKCYIYCSKNKDIYELLWTGNKKTVGSVKDKSNGKIIGEFICNDIIKYDRESKSYALLSQLSCVSSKQLHEYSFQKSYLYGWHISDLIIYDTPRKISEFGLKRPPQSWCYVEADS